MVKIKRAKRLRDLKVIFQLIDPIKMIRFVKETRLYKLNKLIKGKCRYKNILFEDTF